MTSPVKIFITIYLKTRDLKYDFTIWLIFFLMILDESSEEWLYSLDDFLSNDFRREFWRITLQYEWFSLLWFRPEFWRLTHHFTLWMIFFLMVLGEISGERLYNMKQNDFLSHDFRPESERMTLSITIWLTYFLPEFWIWTSQYVSCSFLWF